MGDRALIQLAGGSDLSPVLYMHWSGSQVAEILATTQAIMEGREGDLSYTFARLVAAACEKTNGGNTGIGVWNASEALTADDSHGDAGCFLVNVDRFPWSVKCGGGYGFDDADTSCLRGVEELA